MGVELFKYALPQDNEALLGCVDGNLNGEILQTIGHLINSVRDGESGQKFIDDLDDYFTDTEKHAISKTFEQLQFWPRLLEFCFDGASRGHDHWAYLYELATDQNQKLARSAVFGTQPVGASAVGSQGIPIRWSNATQVTEINAFLQEVDFEIIRRNFSGFPDCRVFYKRRSNDELEGCLQEMADINEMYSLAANNGLAIVTILD